MNSEEYDQNDDDFYEDEDIVSKSQKKREMHALLAMAESALQLTDEKLAQTGLDEKILGAFADARKIKKSGARNRQMKFITKLLSHEDSDILESFLLQADEKKQHEKHLFHQLETLRDRLISDGDSVLGEVLTQYPAADRQHIRTLVRQANKETQAQKPPTASRKLFKYLRTLV